MKIIDIWIAKNGNRLSDGTPFIRDGLDNAYILTPVPSDYFYGRKVEHITRVMPDNFNEKKL